MTACDVCVRGDGIVGSSLALLLATQGLSVALEMPATPTPKGDDVRTYALNAASRDLLQKLRVWDALPADAVTPVHEMRIRGDRAPARLEFSAYQQCVEALAWIVDAAAVEAALATALRFAPHVTTRAAPSTAAGAGRPADAALLAIAEGRDAATRTALGLRMQRQPYGHSALAARLTATEGHANVAHQWFSAPEVLALLPFDRPQPGHSHGLVWSVPQERAEALRAQSPAEFEAALATATGGEVGALRLASERQTWPLSVAQAEATSGEGWVLLGDAAHSVHPLAGQGLNLGLADAQTLATVLAAREPWRALGDARLLRRYERERAAPTALLRGVTDGLWQLFASPVPGVRELRNRGLNLVNGLPPLKRWLAAQALHS